MAKYERSLNGHFDDFLQHLHLDITKGSLSATFEEGSDLIIGPVRLAVRAYERYSMMGGNRVSLHLVLAGEGDRLHLCAMTTGGSQAVFFKLNTFGEEAFLDRCIESVERYLGVRGRA